MIMTLPDGRKFRLVPVDEITLNDQILCQKTTGIGPTQLHARLLANQAKLWAQAQAMRSYQDVAADAEKAPAAVLAFEATVADTDIDVMAEAVHIWLSRRAAGERDLTLEQACDFPLAKAKRELEPEEIAALEAEQKAVERDAVDPTSPSSGGGSVNGSGPNRATRRATAKSQTSKRT